MVEIDVSQLKRGVSLYVHIPFCSKKCDYCHFFVLPNKEPYHELLFSALLAEFARIKPLLQEPIASIYFGGGTPWLFGPRRVAALLEAFLSHPWAEGCEITLEANPEHIDRDTVLAYKLAGINRLSLGAQGFSDGDLAMLSRKHTGFQAEKAVETVFSAGISNISIDLIYDVPGQTLASWQHSLDVASRLPIQHLSLYNLTIEPHTAYHKFRKRLVPLLPSEDASLAMLQAAVSALGAVGLKRYEISAFCKGESFSRHNVGYWVGRPFWGLGPSAFSYEGGRRFRNICNLKGYASALETDKWAHDFSEKLEEPDASRELLMVELRLLQGVAKVRFACLDDGVLDKLLKEGYLIDTGLRYKLSEKGLLFYDTVAELCI